MNPTLKPLLRIATFAALLLGASGVQANLISVDYASPGDHGITRDTATGLDWLDLPLTYGYSVAAVPSLTAAGGSYPGFRLATAAEFDTLYANAGLTHATWSGSPNATDPAYLARARALQDLLGYSTFSDAYVMGYISGGFLDGDLGTYRRFGLVAVYDFQPQRGTDYYRAESYSVTTSSSPSTGLYLVRSTPVVPTASVPDAGGTLTLLGGGLLGLTMLHRRRRQ